MVSKVSIIILAQDTAIAKTLESVLQQTSTHWEAIVIYDPSCDRLKQTLISFAESDSRITLVARPQINISTARNIGAELAQHDWLLFIDAGDWLFPEHLEKFTAQLTEAPNSDLVFCNWALFTEEEQQIDSFAYNVFQFSELETDLFNHLRVCNQFPLHAAAIKKTVFDKAGGFTSELATGDWDLWQRIIALKGISYTSINLVLAGRFLKPDVCSATQQLSDGLQIIARGFKSHSQLKQSQNEAAIGSPLCKIADAQFYWTGYCVGIAIALGQDYLPLLTYLASQENFAAISIDFEPAILDRAIVNGIRDAAYTNEKDFAALWVRIQPSVNQFYRKLSQHSGIYFQILPRIQSIETILLERLLYSRPIALTQFQAVSCDLTQPIVTQTIDAKCEILNCLLRLAEKPLGSIDLPIFDGQVSGLVLADAIAERYVWQVLDLFFKQNVYSELRIKKTESGIVVKRGDLTLVEGLTPSPNLRQQISDKITWAIFLQELWGAIDWQEEASFLPSPVSQIGDREWLIVEVSEDLTDVAVTQNVIKTVVKVGGVSIGVIDINVEAEVLTAAQIRSEIVAQAGFELARAAVREGLLGQPLNGELPLRERLSQAARERQNSSGRSLFDNTLSNTDNLLDRFLSSEQKTIVMGYRQTQPIGTSASRWATLPTSMINELTECAKLAVEAVVEIGEAQQPPQQILYTPDLIVPQIFEQSSNALSNSTLGGNSRSSKCTYRLPILMYHQVSPFADRQPNRWHLSSQLFEEQLRYLRDKGFYSVTLEDWRKSIVSRQPLPGNAILITFDDGYQNFYTYAWSLLKKYGFSATVFLIVDAIGSQMANHPCMGWSEIKQLQSQGVEFGSHSLDHPSFTDISYVELVRQAVGSRVILSRELGVPINAIAYPYGNCNSLVKYLVGSCGYTFGLEIGFEHSTWQDSLLGLSRMEIENIDTLPRFIRKLDSQTN